MAWGYWALSGGSDFVPQKRQSTVLASQDTPPADAPPTAESTPAAAELEADAARAAALIALAASEPAATPDAVAPPVFTPLSERRATLAALAAAEAAERAQASLTNASLRPAADAGPDLRVVDADRVNLRDGPGTDFAAIDQLTNGTIAEVLEYGTGNWVRVQVQGTTQTGWMSSNFLLSLD